MKNEKVREVVIIAIVALIALWLVFVYANNKASQSSSAETAESTSQGQISSTAQQDTEIKYQTDKAEVLRFLKPDATAQERDVYVALVMSKAVAASQVFINACRTSPLVALVKNGSSIDFVNNDKDSEHVISFDPKHVYKVSPDGKTRVTFDFTKYPGVRKYTCDSEYAGAVFLTN